MIELMIDGVCVDIDQKTVVAITLEVADVQEPSDSTAGYSKTIELPFTPRNMRVFRFVNELYSKEQFNNALHTAEYIVDGTVVMSGVAQIEKMTYVYSGNRTLLGGGFHVSIIGAAFEWITSAKKQINELLSDEVVIYNLDNVYANSIRTDPSLIKFFPVDRGAFYEEGESPRRTLDLRDYHPFINAWKLLLLIFSGYTIRTTLEGLLSKLYFSGVIPESGDASYVEDENDFKAGNSLFGEMQYGLTASNNYTQDFNLFDTWDSSIDSNFFVATPGILISDTGNGYTVFKPTEKCRVGFDITLFMTANVIGGEVAAFADTLILGEGSQQQSVRISPDASEEAKNRQTVISVETGARTLIFARLNTTIYKRITLRYTDSRGIDKRMVLVENLRTTGQWFTLEIPLVDDEGLYMYGKYVVAEEDPRETGTGVTIPARILTTAALEISIIPIPEGTLTFKNTLSLSGYDLTGSSDHVSLRTAFACSERRNVYISLGTGFTISPTFGSYIGVGENVGISDVGGTSTQQEFLAAIRQIFNLIFYTNPLTKEVFVEPRSRFYDLNNIIDWRAKMDYTKSIEIEELGMDVGNALKLGYSDGNDVVKRYNWKNHTELGVYNTPLLNKVAEDIKEIINPVFTPFLLHAVESVGIMAPQNAPDKTRDIIGDVDLNISPIIGYFGGIKPRTGGIDTVRYSKYPILLFQDADQGVNLGFEDISGIHGNIPGLRKFYKNNISFYDRGRRITAYLTLAPHDVESILKPNVTKRDFRAVFKLNINGEDVICLLEKIENYNPANGGSAKCVFITYPNIEPEDINPDIPDNPDNPWDYLVISHNDTVIINNDTAVGYRID